MPFGIDDALIWGPMIGAALGGLTNKKDPLQGALLGGAMGYGGAALAGGGGLLGSSSAALPGANTAAELAAAQGSLAPGSAAMLEKPASLLTQAKPFMDAAGTGMQVANQFKEQPMPITPSPITPPTFNNAPGQMVASMQQQQAERMAMEQQRRMQRRQMRGGLL